MVNAAIPIATEYRSRSGRPERFRLKRDFYVPSDAFGVRATLTLLAILFLVLNSLSWLYGRQGFFVIVLLFPLLAAYIYKLTILLHESTHRTLFRHRSLNVGVGWVAASLLASGFRGYSVAHWQHHRHCGTEEDTDEGDALRLRAATRRQLVLHLLKPLSGIAFIEVLTTYLRAQKQSDSLTERPARRERLTPWAELASILAAQTVVATVATGLWRYPLLALVYPCAGATLALFFSRTRAFCEHTTATGTEGQCFARTHRPFWFDRIFFYTLNMNFHVEHHWYPQVPACHLPRLHRELVEAGHVPVEMIGTSVYGTIRSRLAAASHTAS